MHIAQRIADIIQSYSDSVRYDIPVCTHHTHTQYTCSVALWYAMT